MTIKKLTVAAAIAVGIATCSLNQAMAACPCAQEPVQPAPCAEPMPVVTGHACPCETAKPNTCSKCKKAMPDCDCKKADPCEKPCDPCEEQKSDCGCPDEVSCDKPAVPATALCPGTGKPDRQDMKQVYGYPNAIYGANNYVGHPASSIFSTDSAFLGTPNVLQSNLNGVTVSSDGQITGAASQLPCLNEAPTRHNGIPIDRNERIMDGNNCPIDFQSSNSIDALRKSFVPYEIPNTPSNVTGAAANFGGCSFPDVPQNFWAACDIDKLAINNVVVGYPEILPVPNLQQFL